MDYDVKKYGHGVGRMTYLTSEERRHGEELGDYIEFHDDFDEGAKAEIQRIIDDSEEIQTRLRLLGGGRT
jgi:hypothetical protein